MRLRWHAVQWGLKSLFALVALAIYADARPPSRLALRRRTARALGLPPPGRPRG
jgi:hypothetical protein